MTSVSRQDGCLNDLCFQADFVVLLHMCQGWMGDFITYVSRQEGCLYYLCVKAEWVLILLMCQRMAGCIAYDSRQDG